MPCSKRWCEGGLDGNQAVMRSRAACRGALPGSTTPTGYFNRGLFPFASTAGSFLVYSGNASGNLSCCLWAPRCASAWKAPCLSPTSSSSFSLLGGSVCTIRTCSTAKSAFRRQPPILLHNHYSRCPTDGVLMGMPALIGGLGLGLVCTNYENA